MIEFRLIGVDELEAVKRLSEGVFTYDGKTSHDYFPCYFRRWAESSNHYMYGLYVNGELVAAKCDTVFDNGKTLFGQALRVSKHHRGMRYVEELEKRAALMRLELIYGRYPIERVRYAVADHEGKSEASIEWRLKKFPQTKYLCTRTCLTATIHQTGMIPDVCALSTAESKIREISPKEAYTFAMQHTELFPHQTLYSDWEAHELTYENFIIMATGGQGTYEKKFLLCQTEGQQSLAVCGFTERGIGFCGILEIFTNNERHIQYFSSFVLQNLDCLRTYHSFKKVDHFWWWIPFHLQSSHTFQNLLATLAHNPTFYVFRCLYFETPPITQTQAKL